MDQTLNRYPGVSPFSERQKDVFFGRDTDIMNLMNLILLREQILLYAKSGVGKTSLLNAGVLPRLRDTYTPVQIRFTAYTGEQSETPVQNVINKLKSLIKPLDEGHVLNRIINNDEKRKSIWYYLKVNQISDKPENFVLVFDQFEELFTYPDAQINEFKNQLSEILSSTLPKSIKNLIRQNKNEFLKNKEAGFIFNELDIKIIYAIRSDKLSLLNRLSDKISNIQRDFYELKPLSIEQAINAIVKPAQKEGNFSTPPFAYNSDTLDRIIDILSEHGKQAIETTQLQIVCQKIELIAAEKAKSLQENEQLSIRVEDLPEFKDIFFDFYESSINKTSDPVKTRVFIEDHLIRNEQRISLDERICLDYIDRQDLRILTRTHLLRAEPNSTGSFNYELSHDSLLEPILISKRNRKEKEAQEEALRKAEAEKQRLLEERKRQRKLVSILSIAAIISIAFAVFGFYQAGKAKRKQSLLEREKYNHVIDELSIRMKEASDLAAAKGYEFAIKNFKESYKKLTFIKEDKKFNELKADDKQYYENLEIALLDSIRIYENKKRLQQNSLKLKRKADSLFETKNFVSALKKYNQLYEVGNLRRNFMQKKIQSAIDSLKLKKDSNSVSKKILYKLKKWKEFFKS